LGAFVWNFGCAVAFPLNLNRENLMGLATSFSKTKRQIQQAVSGEEPQIDVLETIKEEHEEVVDFLKKMVDSESRAERKSLLKKIKMALVPHVRAEEKVVYDAILALRDRNAKIDGEEGYLEHGLADKMLATLGKIKNAMSPEFSAAAKVLKELIEHHVKEEENNVWSDVKKHFSIEQRYAMNVKFGAAKKSVKIPN
jgi:hemerythrin-like domain-containing protein